MIVAPSRHAIARALLVAASIAACSRADPVVVAAPEKPAPAPSESAGLAAPAPSASASSARSKAPAASECLPITNKREGISQAVWSPRGARVAVSCSAGVEVIDVAPRRALAFHHGAAKILGFRNDGEAVAISDVVEIHLITPAAASAAPLFRIPGGTGAIAISPSFLRIAAADDKGVVTLYDAASGAALTTLGGAKAFGWVDLAWSPDGARVVTASDVLELWDAANGALIHAWKPSAREELSREPVRFASDGATLFARVRRASTINGEGHVYAFDTATFARKGPWPAVGFTVARDGKTLFASETCKLLRTELQPRVTKVLYHNKSEDCGRYTYRDLDVSGDGRWLTAFLHMMSGTALYAFDAQTGAQAPWR